MARAVRIEDPVPFHQMNVTPFIDVMLVLLVMMILSVPLATHKVAIDLPRPRDGAVPAETPHLLAIDAQGAVTLDGQVLGDAELRPALVNLQADPNLVLHLRADPEARYDRFDAVLAIVKRAGVARLGFVGNRPLEE
jgi:biopolymer transport protein ExbD